MERLFVRSRDRAAGALDRPGRDAPGGHRDPLLRDRRQRRPDRGHGGDGSRRHRRHSSRCEDRAVPIDDRHMMVSMPYVNPTPWKTPREAPEPELERRGSTTVAGDLPDHGRRHLQLPRPAQGFDPRHLPDARWTHRPAVARSSRRASPSCTERAARPSATPSSATSRCSDCMGTSTSRRRRRRLGRTLCVNPGSEYGEGVLRGLPDHASRTGQVKGYQMTAG